MPLPVASPPLPPTIVPSPQRDATGHGAGGDCSCMLRRQQSRRHCPLANARPSYVIRVTSCSRAPRPAGWVRASPAFARRAFFLPSAARASAGRGRPVDAKSPWSAPAAGSARGRSRTEPSETKGKVGVSWLKRGSRLDVARGLGRRSGPSVSSPLCSVHEFLV
jgi:hypothetical protein